MSYRLPVKDPWFSANLTPPPSAVASVPGSGSLGYLPDSYVSAMACIDQYQVCNPATSPFTCTVLGRFTEVIRGFSQINLNEYQIATTFVATHDIPTSTTYWVTLNLGTAPLLAQELVYGAESSGLPENQWQLEFQSWFKTGLAHLQASVLAYPVQLRDLDPGTEFQPAGSASQAEHDVCSNIRIKNTGGYQSFSTLGLVIILAVGIPIITLSLTIEPCVAALRMRRRLQYQRLHNKEGPDARPNNDASLNQNVTYRGRDDDREVARIADCILQLQRKVLASAAPEARWEAKMQIVPVTADSAVRFSFPRRVQAESENAGLEDGDLEDDYEYRREMRIALQEVEPTTTDDDDQYNQGLLQPEQER